MAQPTAIQYLGSYRVQPNTVYTATDILTAFTGATVIQTRFDDPKDTINVSVNGNIMFRLYDLETSYIASTPAVTYQFDKELTLAVGIYKAV